MTISRRQALVLMGGALAAGAGGLRISAQSGRSHLLLVIDGLRPDYITPDVMPRLYALGRRGISFDAHHSVFPTVTRVNSSSLATGAYPETHGLMGNTIYSAKTFPTKGINTSNHEELEAMLRAEGTLLTAPTLGTVLQQAGRRFTIFSAGSTGAAMLLGYPGGSAVVVNPDYIRPDDLRPKVLAALGAPPHEAVPNNARNRWVVDAYLTFGLKELRSDVTALWFGDPDATAHQEGVGSPIMRQALAHVDEEIGRIEDTLRDRGLLDSTNVLVTSDHGFSTHTGELKLASLVAPFAKTLPDGTPDLVVTEGAINFRAGADPVRVRAIVAELQRRPEVGAIFTRPASPGSMQGVVPGTLSFTAARWAHARSGDVLVSGNWSAETNDRGFAGRTTQGGVAGHGTSSPYDIHNTLVVAGPDFRERIASRTPTSNADIAPTLLRLLGLQVPASMTGRPIVEALRSGPASVPVETRVESVRSADGAYELRAHLSEVAGVRYLDYTEVRRGARGQAQR